jgi:hypothetical protein
MGALAAWLRRCCMKPGVSESLVEVVNRIHVLNWLKSLTEERSGNASTMHTTSPVLGVLCFSKRVMAVGCVAGRRPLYVGAPSSTAEPENGFRCRIYRSSAAARLLDPCFDS